MDLEEGLEWKIVDKDTYIDEEILAGIKRGLNDVEAGRVYTVEEFWIALKEDHGWDFGI